MWFWKSLINCVKNNFKNAIVDGCFFHFVKLLLSKAKSLDLCKKSNLKNTKILIFILKMIPFMKYDDKEILFNKVEEFYSLKSDNYKKMVSYYRRNWFNNNDCVDYYDLNNNKYKNRTNNNLENFHYILNNKLECFHPKISYIIEKYIEYLIEVYNKIKTSFIKKVEIKSENFNIINDILTFIKNINLNYKDKFKFS